MENKWLPLVKVRLRTQLNINAIKYEKDRKIRTNKIAMFIAVVLVSIAFMSYFGVFSYGLDMMGIGEIIPLLSFVLSSSLSFLFTIFKANGELFNFKDYNLLMSLPVKESDIIASRLINIYLWNTIISLIVMLPMGVGYYILYNPGIIVCGLWILSIVIVSLIPTTMATIISAIVAFISSKFKKSNLVNNCLSIGVIIIIFALMTRMNIGEFEIDFNNLKNLLPVMIKSLINGYPISKLFYDAIVYGKISSFILLLLISILVYYIFVQLLSIKYKQINTALSTNYVKSNYEVNNLKRESKLKALYKKEIKRFFSSSPYVMNMSFGLIAAIAFTIALCYFEINRGVISEDIHRIIYNMIPFIISAFIATTCTTSVAMSLEGKNIWILKTVPVNSKVIYDSKILVNLTLCIPVSIVCSSIIIAILKPDLWSSILIIITPIVYSVFTAVWGVFINNRFYSYDWESETQVVKQSISVLLGIIGSIGAVLIASIVVIVFNNGNYNIITTIAILIVSIISWIIYNNESKRKIN